MNIEDREEFNAQARLLFAGFNALASPERLDAYWLGLKSMHLARWSRLVEDALGSNGEKWHKGKLPTVSVLWQRFRDTRAQSRAITGPAALEPVSYPETPWQLLTNRIGIRHCREVARAGPAAVKLCWQAMREIAADFDALSAAKDPQCTVERLQSLLIARFRIICGLPPETSQDAVARGYGIADPEPETEDQTRPRAREERW